jgi:flagellar basal body-associated protein FliL
LSKGLKLNNILKIIIGVIIAVALIYAIVGTFFMSDGKTNTNFSGFGNMVAPNRDSSTVSTDKLEVNVDEILINMRSGNYKYMKADMSFKMKDKSNKDALVKNMPYIRDTILRFSSNQNSNKLATSQGKQQYKQDLKDLIYESYGLSIDDIYFRNFVLAK